MYLINLTLCYLGVFVTIYERNVIDVDVRRRRRSGIAGTGLSLYARLISHFNIAILR